MKQISVLQGVSGVGKTATIKIVFELLQEKYPNVEVKRLMRTGKNINDIKIVLYIDGLIVGIESQGDPNSRLKKSLEEFELLNCDRIICAARTSGMTVDWVNYYKARYKINFITQQVNQSSSQLTSNKKMAQKIIAMVGL